MAKTHTRLLPGLVDGLLRLRFVLLVMCLAAAALSFGPAQRLDFDRSIETLFRADDPRYENYREDKALFGGLETALIAYDDDELFSVAGLERLGELEAQLKAVPGVAGVVSLSQARRPQAPLDTRPLVQQLQTGRITSDELKSEILGADLYRGRLISRDGKTVALLVELAATGPREPARAATIAHIRQVAERHHPPAIVAGGPVLMDDVYRHLEQDGVTLGVASSLILTLVIALLFRNMRWIVLPLFVVQAALVWTRATLVLSGMQMSMVSSPLVALVTVIGVATVVHVTIRFREEREQSAEPPAALRATLIHIVPAIFWTCLTTAAGFAALMACGIAPIQNFGQMMAIGSMFVFVAAVGLTPGIVLLARRFSTDPAHAPGERPLTEALQRTADTVQQRPWHVVLVAMALLAVCSLGVIRLQVATDFTENFRQTSPIVKAFHFFMDRLEGVNTMDILIDLPEPSSPEFEQAIDALRRLQAELEEEAAIVDTLSMVDLLDFVRGGLLPGVNRERTGPDEPSSAPGWLSQLPSVSQSMQLQLLSRFVPQQMAGFWNRQNNVARVFVQVRQVAGSAPKRQLVERIESATREAFPTARTAGLYILFIYVVQSLLTDQWITFALSITGIFLMMTLAFRSWRLGIAALLPNAAPIVMVVGTMGWMGLKINTATAMLASVSMGLAIDFSIHYLYRFQQELASGKPFYQAIRAAHGSVGLAMVLANLALVAGFLVLVMSALIPTVHFGILVSVAMLGGLLGNLVVLPLLLRWLWRIGTFKR